MNFTQHRAVWLVSRKLASAFAIVAGVAAAIVAGLAAAVTAAGADTSPPQGIVFVVVDDLGYGDIDALYPSSVETPHIDDFYNESVRLTDYHGAPLCTPARSMLMTGRYSESAGAWHTITARQFLNADEQTMGDVFQANDWNTGVFGKWHLGDGYPFAPHYRGFDTAVIHGTGAVGSLGDYWGNDYYSGVDFDGNPTTPDIYFRNGEEIEADVYATDFWFDEAQDFIASSVADNKPFLAYIPTNALHVPLNAPNGGKEGLDGMLENIDDNLGELDQFLEGLGIKDDVLVVFTSDNGGLLKFSGRDGDLRGAKGSIYDGGHRVPFFARWANGGIGGSTDAARDVDWLMTGTDVLPTFIDLAGIARPEGGKPFHGYSLADAFTGSEFSSFRRHHVVSKQQGAELSLAAAAVLDDHVVRGAIKHKWRLVGNGETGKWELYDVQVDRAQNVNLAGTYPEVVETLSAKFSDWLVNDIAYTPTSKYEPMIVDSRSENELFVHPHFWLDERFSPIKSEQVSFGDTGTGMVPIRFEEGGQYRFEMRRWPREDGGTIRGYSNLGLYANQEVAYTNVDKARLVIDGIGVAETAVPTDATYAAVEVDIPKGHEGFVTASFLDGTKFVNGAYFMYVSRVDQVDSAVTIYEKPYFSGESVELSVGVYDRDALNQFAVGNNETSSIHVAPGYEVRACRSWSGRKCTSHTAPTATLGLDDDTLSYFEVTRSTSASACANPGNVALGGTTGQSSMFNGSTYGAELAIDGNPNTFMHTGAEQSFATWELSFLTPQKIDQIVLHNNTTTNFGERLRDIEVRVYSADGRIAFASDLLNPENVLGSPDALTVMLPVGTVGDRIQVVRTPDYDQSGDNRSAKLAHAVVLSMGEVEVRGCPVG